MNTLRLLLCLGGIQLFLLSAQAGEAAPELLWPTGAPSATGTADTDKPAIYTYLPPIEKNNGTAVLICPGGGYGALVMSYEGAGVARWLNSYGITGIVLKYRFAPYRHPAPMQDVQRALRLVRSHAAEWKLKPDRIGVIGFSAGGHLASTAGTHFDAGNPSASDPVEKFGCRPDFMVLIYPVIDMGVYGHGGSRANLLGHNPLPELVTLLSNEKQVTAQTPPTFLAHAKTDKVVSSQNSALFAQALKEKGIPYEYLELPTGAHGLGCGVGPEWVAWQTACINWLTGRGLIVAAKPGQ